ncbi:MAG: TrkA family potassium uptake protein [Actinomycetales bacterium]|nr:TrkA family potassium uptake protein [Tetrasphaera sp.]NLW98303.1 TrkA family potassium uptake protein [Actinomycetales bacterium]
MRVVIAGAGSVGISIAKELLRNDHEVLIIDKQLNPTHVARTPGARWLEADACETSALEEAGLATCDVVVGATGDDKVNLVLSLIAKTEFAVPRTVARVNNPRNEWMFDETWGVDVAVSTPRLMTALIEEAVSVGDLVRIFTFQQSSATMVELTLPDDSPYAGARVGDVPFPPDTALVGIIREHHPIAPSPDDTLEPDDELLFITAPDVELDLENMLSPGHHVKRGVDEGGVDDHEPAPTVSEPEDADDSEDQAPESKPPAPASGDPHDDSGA